MEIAYSSPKMEMACISEQEGLRYFGDLARRAFRRIKEMQDAPNLAELRKIQSARCHPLEGDRKGDWAVSLNGPWRLIFTLLNGEWLEGVLDETTVTQVRIERKEQYHG